MTIPKISKQEWPVMDALWTCRIMSIGEIRDWIRGGGRRPTYATVQTMVYRLEARGAVQRVDKIRNFHLFEAAVCRERAEGRLLADLLELLGGDVRPVLEYCVDTGKITMDDVREAERTLKYLERYGVPGTAGRSDGQPEMAPDLLTRPKPPRPSYTHPTYLDLGPRGWMA